MQSTVSDLQVCHQVKESVTFFLTVQRFMSEVAVSAKRIRNFDTLETLMSVIRLAYQSNGLSFRMSILTSISVKLSITLHHIHTSLKALNRNCTLFNSNASQLHGRNRQGRDLNPRRKEMRTQSVTGQNRC